MLSNTEEQRSNKVGSHIVSSQSSKKYPIMCKFWMMSTCLKEDKCEYLHTEKEKIGIKSESASECTMYKMGYCKKGALCTYKHNIAQMSEEEFERMPDFPIWYLEYALGKPINMIFQEFEENNKEEVEVLKQKYIRNLPRKYNKSSYNKSNSYENYQFDLYAEKKDFIIKSLNNKVRYFFIRNTNSEYVQLAMEQNIILNNLRSTVRFKEALKSCDDVILVMFDEETRNFNGFCKYKKELENNDVELSQVISSLSSELVNNYYNSFLKIEWFWKTKLSYDKVQLLKNPLNNDESLVDSKDGQEISIDVGNYLCRLMIKRLTKDEVKDYLEKRKSSINEAANEDNEVSKTISLNNLIYEEINKKSQHNCTSTNSNIIVTNISNLQVNISTNTHKETDYERSRKREKYIKKNDKRYEKTKKRHRSRSSSKGRKRKHKKKSRSSSRSVCDKSKDIQVNLRKQDLPKEDLMLNKKRKPSPELILAPETTSSPKNKVIRHNRLFSNAIKNITIQSHKNK